MTTDSINCSIETAAEDARALLGIQSKKAFRVRSRDIRGAYVAGNDKWDGYATCFERDSRYVVQLEMVGAPDKELLVMLISDGTCEDFESNYVDKFD